jgi:anthranilate phosphoribosyltransferase
VGVFSLELARLYGYLYQRIGADFAIVHSLDGYDEISLTDGFKLIRRDGEKILYPDELGLKTFQAADLHGGSNVEEAADIFLNILEGTGTEAQTQVVIANAALALHAAKVHGSLEECLGLAREAVESGKARKIFKSFVGMNSNSK